MEIFKNGEVVFENKVTPKFQEGEYKATITKVDFLKDQKTDWGFKDFIEISYEIVEEITSKVHKEKLIVSSAEGSRCKNFLLDFYGGEIPPQINLDDFLGRECILTFKHVTGNNGFRYANIEKRDFK